MGAGVTGQCSGNRCLPPEGLEPPIRGQGGAAGRANSKKYQVTGPIRGFCALQPILAIKSVSYIAVIFPRQCSRNRCLARWTVWIPHRGRRGGAGRANSKKDLLTGPIRGFCALHPGEGGAVVQRALHSDPAVLWLSADPSQEGIVTLGMVWELCCLDELAELVHDRRCEGPLVGVHPDRHLHAGLLPSADLPCVLAEDIQASGSTQPSIESLPLARSRPEGRSFSKSTAQPLAATCRFGVTSGRSRTHCPRGRSHRGISYACRFVT